MISSSNWPEGNDGMSKKRMRQIGSLMIFAAFLVLLILYSKSIYGGVCRALDIFEPFLLGGAIAFVLNIPMRGIEEKLLGGIKSKKAAGAKRAVSIAGSIVFVLLILTLVVSIVIPQLKQAVDKLTREIPVFIDGASALLEKYATEYPELSIQAEKLQSIEVNWESVVSKVAAFLKSGVGSMLNSTFSVAGNIISGVLNFLIAFVFAIYILCQKEKLADQGARILKAYLSERACGRVHKVLTLLYKNFTNFITGQCVEAVILGLMFVIAMSIFRFPYAMMIGVLIAFTALIPVVGAFIGCAVGVFLMLIEDPILALWFIILFLVLQQIEGNLIYPKVVGNSVGLPSIWVLMAVTLGGSLFGVAGMLFFIPLLATGYVLLRENVNKRNAPPIPVEAEEDEGEKVQDELNE